MDRRRTMSDSSQPINQLPLTGDAANAEYLQTLETQTWSQELLEALNKAKKALPPRSENELAARATVEGAEPPQKISPQIKVDLTLPNERKEPVKSADESKQLPDSETFSPTVSLETMQQLVVQNTHAIQMVIQILGNSQKPKLLAPEKYNVNNNISMPSFLNKFEKFAQAMYPGSSSEMGSYLGHYLEGKALDMYKSIRNATDDYPEIRQRLLIWEQDEQSKEKGLQDLEFMEATMKPTETVHGYAMRLLSLAKKCFPNSDVTSLPMVVNKFVAGLTPNLNQEVKRAMLLQEATLGIQLPWDRLVAIADKTATFCEAYNPRHWLQTETSANHAPELIDISPVSQIYSPYNNKITEGMAETQFLNSRTQSATHATNYNFNEIPQQYNKITSQKQNLNYNHVQRPQTKSTGGYNHSTVGKGKMFQPKPPNKNINRAGQQQFTSGPAWSCRFCNEEGHTYRYCPQRSLCTWCARRGHVFSECFTAQGICLICKEHGHLPRDCPTKMSATPINVNCPRCNGPHFGKDCQGAEGTSQNFSLTQGN